MPRVYLFFDVQDLFDASFPSAGPCTLPKLKATLEKIEPGSYVVLINERWFSVVKSANEYEIFNCRITAEIPKKQPNNDDPAAFIFAQTPRKAAKVLKACIFVKNGGLFIVTKINLVHLTP